jgi:hypothetical protein
MYVYRVFSWSFHQGVPGTYNKILMYLCIGWAGDGFDLNVDYL